jgi:ABC-type multidrug transport system fused ATPase/permease subunit
LRYLTRVLPYVRPYWSLGLASVVVTVLSSLAGLLTPWPLKILVDNVLGRSPLPGVLAGPLAGIADDRLALLVVAVLGGLLVTLATSGLQVISNYIHTKLEQSIVLDFRRDLFEHAQRLSVAYTDQVSTGRLMYGINFEAAAAGGLVMALQPLAQSGLTILGMVWVSLQIDPQLAVLSLTIVPVLYWLVRYYATHIQAELSRVKGMEADGLSIVHEAMSMLRVISAFCREPFETRRFVDQGRRTVAARVDVTVKQTLFSLGVNLTTAVGTALVLGFGAYHALEGQLTAGELLVMISYVGQVYKPLEAISYTVGSLQDRFVGLQMAFHVLDTEPIITDQPGAAPVDRARGELAFESVSFSYPSRPRALDDISFQVRAGQTVAVVGPTGAGKTTLMSLIPRFYDPAAGRVLLDGIDVRTTKLGSLREQISLVPQEPVLSSGTIADNIRYGRLDASMDEIITAAKAANAHDFVMRLPDGYDTKVGERGAQLSGGERQRISVARAFLKDAPILILDEPTSSIDSRTESVILDALDRLMVGRTTFVIAHRLSTVRHADRILVLDGGRLIQQGTHDELVGVDGLYKQLHEVQVSQRQRGSQAPREMARLAADYLCQPPDAWVAGDTQAYRVTIRNVGIAPWPASGATMVRLSVTFGGASDAPHDGWANEIRVELPHDVAAGESLTMTVRAVSPDQPGSYVLRHRLVQEGVAWFDELQATHVSVATRAHGALASAALGR